MPVSSDYPSEHISSSSGASPQSHYTNGAVAEQGAGWENRKTGQNSTSPVLEALGAIEKVSDAASPYRTDAWARSIPFGRSPPVDSVGGANGSTSPSAPRHTERGGFSLGNPPTSPMSRKPRPISYGGTFPVPVRQGQNEKGYRYQPSVYGSPTPLPHLPQPYFYGARDVDLGLGYRGRETLSDLDASFVGFGQLSSTNQNSESTMDRVILLGADNRFDILAVEAEKLQPIGTLDHLCGTVVDAILLTWESKNDPMAALRPLVALTIHGPVIASGMGNGEDGPPSDESDSSEQDSIAVGVNAPNNRGPSEVPTEYQTRVEVYSLPKQTRVATLFASQVVAGTPNIRGLPASVPHPQGSLRLDTKGNFLTVSSGTSGEVFVYGIDTSSCSAGFRCLAKLWTSVQAKENRRYSSSGSSVDSESSPADLNRGIRSSDRPILSLSSRWLAIAPPGPISHPTLSASILRTSTASRRVPGLESRSAPSLPAVTCTIDSPDAESVLNKVARGVAQEFVKGARWLGDQGLQTWNSYWNKEAQPGFTTAYNRNNSNNNVGPPDLQAPLFFPPTHAQDTQTFAPIEPELVSIIDLKKLEESHSAKAADALTPLATFQPPGGCSFMSFAPNGLSILTANKNGDVQYIWDLMQIRHNKASAFMTGASNFTAQPENSSTSPLVRQVARYARLTSSSIIDVIWTPAVGDCFALVTRNGTVHIFDLPLSAFHWPPARRASRSAPATAPTSPAVNPQQDEPPISGVFASAMKIAGKTQPMFANLRGRAPGANSGIPGMGGNSIGFASVTGARSGKAMAAGLSKSVGAATGTVNTLRHVGENRVHLSNLAKNPATSRIAWDTRRDQLVLSIVDGPSLKSFEIKRAHTSTKAQRQRSSVIDTRNALSTKIPTIENLSNFFANLQTQRLPTQKKDTKSTELGYWLLQSSPAVVLPSKVSHPLSRAEIETNALYQPFHSDKRVGLFVYSTDAGADQAQDQNGSEDYRSSATNNVDHWVFGTEISTTKLNLAGSGIDEADEAYAPGSVSYHQSGLDKEGEDENVVEQIVITTRRRRVKNSNASNGVFGDRAYEDGFFEDDCEVLDFAEDRV